jgi:hypothetical protein
VYICVLWISKQTVIISLYKINCLDFITDAVWLLCGTFYILLSAHKMYLCFVWIWEQTAIISLYSIYLLVFITETQCVYCAVRSTSYFLPIKYIYVLRGSENKQPLFHYTALTGCFYNWDGVCFLRGMFYVLPILCIYVFCGSQNKQRLFHCNVSTDRTAWWDLVREREGERPVGKTGVMGR